MNVPIFVDVTQSQDVNMAKLIDVDTAAANKLQNIYSKETLDHLLDLQPDYNLRIRWYFNGNKEYVSADSIWLHDNLTMGQGGHRKNMMKKKKKDNNGNFVIDTALRK